MTPVQTIETDDTPSFADWIQRNSRFVGMGAALVLVAGAGYWFYLRSADIKRQNAERGLNQAKQSLAAGNAALATTDLQRVGRRKRGVACGQRLLGLVQAALGVLPLDVGAAEVEPVAGAGHENERRAHADEPAVPLDPVGEAWGVVGLDRLYGSH